MPGVAGKKNKGSKAQDIKPAVPPSLQAQDAPKIADGIEPEQVVYKVAAQNGAASSALKAEDNPIWQIWWKRLLKELSSLPRAIAFMAIIAGLSGLGTIIPQNKVLMLAWGFAWPKSQQPRPSRHAKHVITIKQQLPHQRGLLHACSTGHGVHGLHHMHSS